MTPVRNWANWAKLTNPIGEENRSPSMTVPNQTLSLQELLKRYVRGQDVTVMPGVYHGEDHDMPDIEHMDAVERLELAQKIRGGIESAQERNAKIAEAKKVEAEQKAKDEKARMDAPYPAPGDSPIKDSPVPPKASS